MLGDAGQNIKVISTNANEFDGSLNDPESMHENIVMPPRSDAKRTIGEYSSQVLGVDGAFFEDEEALKREEEAGEELRAFEAHDELHQLILVEVEQ